MIYLIQRATIHRPFIDAALTTAVNLDYMGNAEFEFGALPESLHYMEAAKAELKLVTFPEVRREDGRELVGYGVFSNRDAYARALAAVIDGKMHCKSYTNLPDAMRASTRMPPYARVSEKERKAWLDRLTNFWWDIRNHVMLSFEADFMQLLPNVLQKSWDIMNGVKTVVASAEEVQQDAVAEQVVADVAFPKDGDLVVTVGGAYYDGTVVAKLRDRKGKQHSLLVDIGGKVGRLPVTELNGTLDEQNSRSLSVGDAVRVRVIRINAHDSKFVLSERAVD